MSRWPGRIISKTPVTPGGVSPTASAPGVWTLPEMAYWKKQGLWPDASADAYWGYVSFLLSTSSLSNANNNLFVDSSGAFSPVSRNGNPTQGTQTPYGTLWSNYLDGSSYLSAPANSAFAFGTGDFTVECWVNFISGSASGRITNRAPGGGASGTWGFNISPTTFAFTEVVAGEPGVNASGLPNMTNAWVHLAACRSGSTLRLFANGVLVGSGSNTTNFNNSSYGLGIGAAYETAITGYMSNVRIVKGTALYTAAFTPPVAPLTAISGTSLLTCQSNRFRDNSSNAFAITLTGTPRVTPYSPFILNGPGAVYNQSDISYWSGYFDGTSDSLSYTGGSSIAFGTGDFTIELWAYLTNTGTYSPFLRPDDSGVFPEFGYDFGAGQLKFDARNSAIVAVTTTMPTAQWVHLAACRSGTNLRLFVNGSQVGTTTTNSTNFGTTTGVIRLGGSSFSASHTVNGYLSNFRVVNGTALYTGNFTPPTAPLTAVSNTSLLTCQNAAFTDNSTNNFVITANGNATVTGNNPYQSGYYSNYFDGSGDYLQLANNSAFAPLSGDFTVEAWIFPTVLAGQYVTPIAFYATSNATATSDLAYAFYITASNKLEIAVYVGGTAYRATSTANISANTWTHVAGVRSGNTVTAYINGVSAATVSVSGSLNDSTSLIFRVGAYQESGTFYYFPGYISNLRLVKGTAVYTSAFTPSTTPLTAITNTSLLTCQANRLIDSSANAFALTKVGDTSVSPFDPFYTATVASNGGSMYFDGNGDYLSLASNPGFSIGTSTTPFTIEGWLYPTAAGGVVFTEVYTGSGTIPISITMATNANSMDPTGGRYIAFGAYNGSAWTVAAYSSSQIQLNTWTHVACVFTGSTTKIFFNGVDVTAGTPATTWPVTGVAGDGWYVGRRWDTYADVYFSGYISNFRFTNGTAVYTSAFTPPAAPLTPSGNTVLLLNGMNGGVYDAAMQQNMETVGNAQVGSAQVKYGTTSVYFDGTGDYLAAPDSVSLELGSGDFTIEAWVYLPSLPASGGIYAIVSKWVGSQFSYLTQIKNNSGTMQLGFAYSPNGSSVTTVYANASVTAATWHHCAWVRNGTSFKMFLNGSEVTSGVTISGAIADSTATLNIGRNGDNIEYLTGYLDDVRITRGYARYTANFTPPTAALPVY